MCVNVKKKMRLQKAPLPHQPSNFCYMGHYMTNFMVSRGYNVLTPTDAYTIHKGCGMLTSFFELSGLKEKGS
jgi:hypothetical protein